MEFSNVLVEDYLEESYTSHAAASEQDRLAAEKAFNTELRNGPMKTFTMKNGQSFQKPVGTFDLDNFHKAYDKYLEDHGLLNLFNDQGKFINQGTYGTIMNLDVREPANKALKTLWGAQFKYDMRITNLPGMAAIQAQRAAEQAAREAEKKRQDQVVEDTMKRIHDEIYNAIVNSEDYKKMLKEYTPEEQQKIKVGVYSNVVYDQSAKKPRVYSIDAEAEGVLYPPKTVPTYNRIRVSNPKLSVDDCISEAIKQIPGWADMIRKTTYAANYFAKNYGLFTVRPESKLLIDNNVNILVYKKGNIFYKADLKDFQGKKGLILTNLSDPKDRFSMLTGEYELVAARLHSRSENNGRGYSESSHDDYFNSDVFTEDAAKAAGMFIKEKYSDGNCDAEVAVGPADAPFNKYFNKVARYELICDSSD